MATVKKKLQRIVEMEERVEAGVAELQRGIKETTDRVEAAVAEIQRGTKEIADRFDKYAREDFWG